MIALLTPLLIHIGIPERFHRAAMWTALALLAIAAVCIWFAVHDAAVITHHEDKREAVASGAREKSAEERAADAMTGMIVAKERETAIAKAEASEAAKPVEQRATVAPQAQALNCARLKRAGLTGSLQYREVCL